MYLLRQDSYRVVELRLAYRYIPDRKLSVRLCKPNFRRVMETLAATGTASGDGRNSALVSPRPGASSTTGSAAFLLIV